MNSAGNTHRIKKKGSLKAKAVFLLIQTMLPFFLYFAIIHDRNTVAAVVAGLIILSMGMLVWLE